jgi:NTE family protein
MPENSYLSRALIFQGDGSLGAYEAGVFRALYKLLSKQIKDNENVFDIIAGTSMGAVNAAIIVSHVVENRRKYPSWSMLKCWEGSAERLEEFWNDVSSNPILDLADNTLLRSWYDYWHKSNPVLFPSWESIRRYYSAKMFASTGVPKTFSSFIRWNERFGDTYRFQIRHDYEKIESNSLKGTMEKFVKFPIKTDFEKDEPRLLLVAVDIKSGDRVAFDSHSTKSEYGRSEKSDPVADHPGGLTYCGEFKPSLAPPDMEKPPYRRVRGSPEEMRPFWKGSLSSKSILFEVLNAQKNFYYAKEGLDECPALEVYLTNLWPSELAEGQEGRTDNDFVSSRSRQLIFHDRDKHDEEMALMVTDYMNLNKKMKDLISEAIDSVNTTKRRELTHRLDNILDQEAKKKKGNGRHMKYRDLLREQVHLEKIHHIERPADPDVIEDEDQDFSTATINLFLEQGYTDTFHQLEHETMAEK